MRKITNVNTLMMCLRIECASSYMYMGMIACVYESECMCA